MFLTAENAETAGIFGERKKKSFKALL